MLLNKIALISALFLCLSIPAFCQTPANGCPVGQTPLTMLANVGLGCGPAVQPFGSYIQSLNQSAAIATQTICDTGNTCPAGFYSLHVYMRTVTVGTLVSAVTGNITFTDDASATPTTQALGAAMSLLGQTPFQATYNFYHAANTAVTVNTTTTTLTGSPTYNARFRLIYLGS